MRADVFDNRAAIYAATKVEFRPTGKAQAEKIIREFESVSPGITVPTMNWLKLMQYAIKVNGKLDHPTMQRAMDIAAEGGVGISIREIFKDVGKYWAHNRAMAAAVREQLKRMRRYSSHAATIA